LINNLAWVSPYSVNESSGGWKGMNHHLYNALKQAESIELIPQLYGRQDRLTMLMSRLLTVATRRRLVWSYSNPTLLQTARTFCKLAKSCTAGAFFFFGSSDYLLCTPDRPYYCYLDSAFVPYLKFYEQHRRYLNRDLIRLQKLEAQWLQNCNAIFTSSEFARQAIINELDVDDHRIHSVLAGPNLESEPGVLLRKKTSGIVFISTDFFRKGGEKIVQAVKKARIHLPDIQLHIIGQKPPSELCYDFVVTHGWIDRTNENGKNKFEKIMRESSLSVMLSKADLTPLGICESFAYGLPCMATRVGGIPEMIQHGKNGWLVDQNDTPEQVAEVLVNIFRNTKLLKKVSRQTNQSYKYYWNWNTVAKKISNIIREPD